MIGFKYNDLAVELMSNLSSKERRGLELAILSIRNHFPLCDIYPAYNLKGGLHRISFGIKKLNAQKASACLFRIRERPDEPIKISMNTEGSFKEAIESGVGNIETLRFTLESVALDISKFDAFLDEISKIPQVAKSVAGTGMLPDSYELDQELEDLQESPAPVDVYRSAIEETRMHLIEVSSLQPIFVKWVKGQNIEFIGTQIKVASGGYADSLLRKNGKLIICELKVIDDCSDPKNKVRMALGQLLEYSLWPENEPEQEVRELWLVLDKKPNEALSTYLKSVKSLFSPTFDFKVLFKDVSERFHPI